MVVGVALAAAGVAAGVAARAAAAAAAGRALLVTGSLGASGAESWSWCVPLYFANPLPPPLLPPLPKPLFFTPLPFFPAGAPLY